VTVSHDTVYFGSVILSESRRVALATVKEDWLEVGSRGMNGVFSQIAKHQLKVFETTSVSCWATTCFLVENTLAVQLQTRLNESGQPLTAADENRATPGMTRSLSGQRAATGRISGRTGRPMHWHWQLIVEQIEPGEMTANPNHRLKLHQGPSHWSPSDWQGDEQSRTGDQGCD